ncbi:aminoglycoside phosphotransferase family protein [Prosthecobacter sp. SYSU 5D2]|uniref:phosphotransferase family protein n=1 Tax=Prosthecobacter sp. SYSU 5D2 TaxID=3134134 RepID=UPI0031FEE7F2
MSRRHIHYWKCDRPAAFHGTSALAATEDLSAQVHALLQSHHPGLTISLTKGGGQGNHRTFITRIGHDTRFIRIEDGPEQDDYIETESRVQEAVRSLGLPTPQVIGVDASRTEVPFAWQIMELISQPDLNHWHKLGQLDLPRIAQDIGSAVARWQGVPVTGFGPFQSGREVLTGYHDTYAAYFLLNLDRHLAFLTEKAFLFAAESQEICQAIADHESLLALDHGCLVHKDLALWNILGSEHEITAFIDWDDSISGDPMDDLSLLACFHDGPVIANAIEGYTRIKPLPTDHRRRFWMHLLRNMIVKSVIRVGAGYFDRSDGFFLINSGSNGSDLRTLTRSRLRTALHGLLQDHEIHTLQ